MARIEPPELGEELADLELQAVRQRGGGRVDLLELDDRLAFRRDLQDDVRLTAEVGIDRALEDDLDVLNGEAALRRVVAARLEGADIARGRSAGGEEAVQREVEVVLPAGAGEDRHRSRGQGRHWWSFGGKWRVPRQRRVGELG